MSRKNKKHKPEDKKEIYHLFYLKHCDGGVGYYNAWNMEEIDEYAVRNGIYNGGCYAIIKGGNLLKSCLD